MAKQQTNIRMSTATREKLDTLTIRYGTQAEAVAVAIDRLFQQEGSKMITITSVETKPQLDPYHRDTGGETSTQLWIDPDKRHAGIHQIMDQGAIDAAIWHNLIVTAGFDIRPDEKRTDEYLHSTEAQTLLCRICDGHTTEWNGNNIVGQLNNDAENALADLFGAIENLPDCDWTLWSADDWLSEVLDDYVSADTTDEKITQIAAELKAEANNEHIIIMEDIADYLMEERDRLRNG